MNPIVMLVILLILGGGAFYAYKKGLIGGGSSGGTSAAPYSPPQIQDTPEGTSRAAASTYDDTGGDVGDDAGNVWEDDAATVWGDDAGTGTVPKRTAAFSKKIFIPLKWGENKLQTFGGAKRECDSDPTCDGVGTWFLNKGDTQYITVKNDEIVHCGGHAGTGWAKTCEAGTAGYGKKTDTPLKVWFKETDSETDSEPVCGIVGEGVTAGIAAGSGWGTARSIPGQDYSAENMANRIKHELKRGWHSFGDQWDGFICPAGKCYATLAPNKRHHAGICVDPADTRQQQLDSEKQCGMFEGTQTHPGPQDAQAWVKDEASSLGGTGWDATKFMCPADKCYAESQGTTANRAVCVPPSLTTT